MSGPAELAIAAGVLVDAGLKATVLLGLGWAATRALRHRSAAQRHAVWAVTFAALPALPLIAAQRGPEIALDAPWLVGLWATGFAAACLPMARGLWRLRSLHSDPDDHTPSVRYSDEVAGPVTWGVIRPVIVLPTAAKQWSAVHRDAALAHERAHVARGDWAVHLAVWCISALFWFHPLVWWARSALAGEAEHAADDAVLAQGVKPSEYATLLVSLARVVTPQAALGVSSSLVGTRVHALLDARSRSARRWPVWTLAVAMACVSLPALGAWPTWTASPASLTCAPEGGSP